jgi:hypothetical protein
MLSTLEEDTLEMVAITFGRPSSLNRKREP